MLMLFQFFEQVDRENVIGGMKKIDNNQLAFLQSVNAMHPKQH